MRGDRKTLNGVEKLAETQFVVTHVPEEEWGSIIANDDTEGFSKDKLCARVMLEIIIQDGRGYSGANINKTS